MTSRLVTASLRALALLSALCSAAAFAQSAGKTEILWLGQATTRITTPGGKVIVIDPWLTLNPKTPANFKNLDALGKVDLILVTHAHFDHFAAFGPTGPKITAVHAEHSSELTWKNPESGKDEIHVGGEPVGFIVEMENGFKIWHMGDTGTAAEFNAALGTAPGTARMLVVDPGQKVEF